VKLTTEEAVLLLDYVQNEIDFVEIWGKEKGELGLVDLFVLRTKLEKVKE